MSSSIQMVHKMIAIDSEIFATGNAHGLKTMTLITLKRKLMLLKK